MLDELGFKHQAAMLHFDHAVYAGRIKRLIERLVNQDLDGILLFRQESMNYLTGYDTFGYCFFQCLYLGIDGRMTLLTRAPDQLQAEFTSIIKDIRIWVEGPEANPAIELREILRENGCENKRLGIEWESYGLTGRNAKRVDAALTGFCYLEDASELVSQLRIIKSPAELEYVRKAAELADRAYYAAEREIKAGAFEGDILAKLQGAIYQGGGDDPANEVVIGSGPGAMMGRYYSGRRYLEENDQLTLEWAGVYRHYHYVMMKTFLIGNVDSRVRALHELCVESLLASEEALRPGRPLGDVYSAYLRVLDQAGYDGPRLNACGYSLGATYAPTWMDWPMLYRGNQIEAVPGMIFFIQAVAFDMKNGLAMTLGRTSIVTEKGSQALSQIPLNLVVK